MFCRLAFAAALLILGPGCHAQRDTADAATTIYVVRHAEKADPTDHDTPLSAQGHERAEALAGLLRNEGVDAVYATEFKRTQQTASPLARAIHTDVVVVKSDDQAGLLEKVRTSPHGTSILIVGHSNTVPGIVQELSGEPVDAIAEDDFSNLFKVTLHADGRKHVERLTYGAPKP